MKRVLILANNDVGLYKFRKELIMELLKDNKVFISLPYGDFIPELIKLGCEFEECNFNRHGTNPISEIKQILYYKKLIKKVKPDIVFTYTIKPNIYGGIACSLHNVPYVANITGLGTAVENPGLMQKITITLYKLGLRKAKTVFFQNEENKNFMISKKIVKGHYKMIPGSGVNLAEYLPLDYPNDRIVNFVFIARIMKEKGIEQYLNAAKYIKNKYPYTRFHICGSCEEDYMEYLNTLEEEGIIIYHGLSNDILSMHKISACTIHPTYYPEGLSNVLLESCACARPIITTNRSGCREVIDDGINGYICREKDSEDLIKQIEKFLSLSWEERKQMGLEGRKKVEKEFDRQIVISNYMEELIHL